MMGIGNFGQFLRTHFFQLTRIGGSTIGIGMDGFLLSQAALFLTRQAIKGGDHIGELGIASLRRDRYRVKDRRQTGDFAKTAVGVPSRGAT